MLDLQLSAFQAVGNDSVAFKFEVSWLEHFTLFAYLEIKFMKLYQERQNFFGQLFWRNEMEGQRNHFKNYIDDSSVVEKRNQAHYLFQYTIINDSWSQNLCKLLQETVVCVYSFANQLPPFRRVRLHDYSEKRFFQLKQCGMFASNLYYLQDQMNQVSQVLSGRMLKSAKEVQQFITKIMLIQQEGQPLMVVVNNVAYQEKYVLKGANISAFQKFHEGASEMFCGAT